MTCNPFLPFWQMVVLVVAMLLLVVWVEEKAHQKANGKK